MKRSTFIIAVLFCANSIVGHAQEWDYLVVGFQSNNVIAIDIDTGETDVLAEVPSLRPRGIAVNDKGEIFLGLRQGGRNIIKLVDDGDGGYTWQDFSSGAIGSFGPGMMEFAENGNLFASGDNAQAVFEFDGKTGQQLGSYPIPGNNMLGLAISGNNVYAAGFFTDRIYVFDATQQPVSGELFIDDDLNLNNPLGIDIGPDNILTTVNNGQQGGPTRLHQYDLEGNHLGYIYEVSGRDIDYHEKTDTYFVTSGSALLQIDQRGKLLNSFTHPSLTSAYGVAKYVPPFVLLGDVNLDDFVDLLDVVFFVARLTSGEYQAEADTNLDGQVDLADVEPFVDLLAGGS